MSAEDVLRFVPETEGVSVKELFRIAGIFSPLEQKMYDELVKYIRNLAIDSVGFRIGGNLKKLERLVFRGTTPDVVEEEVLPAEFMSVVQGEALDPNAAISDEQITQFVTEGYLKIESVVDISKIDACNFVINHNLGIPGAVAPGGAQEGLGKLQGSLTQHPTVRSLFTEPLLVLVDALLGQGKCDLRNLSGQLALRFPEYEESNSSSSSSSSDSISSSGSGKKKKYISREDFSAGRCWHTDGLRRGRIIPFTMLLGVCLSDCEERVSDYQ